MATRSRGQARVCRGRRRRRGRGRCSGWCRGRASTPHLLVDGVLRGEGGVEGRILAPASGDVLKVALALRSVGKTGAAYKRLDGHLVQALALFAGRAAKGGVEVVRDVAEGVLHTLTVGDAGKGCKQ